MNLFFLLDTLTYLLFIAAITHYLATTLQWYNYSFARIIFKHHKRAWHIYYCIVPLLVYIGGSLLYQGVVWYVYFYLCYLPMLIVWHRSLDKKLVWTPRIKRLFGIIALCVIAGQVLFFILEWQGIACRLASLVPLLLGFLCAHLCELSLLRGYARLAQKKIAQHTNLIIIAITGSYGKTSTKNFIAQILSEQFSVYATPRSVNTYKGLIADINQNIVPTHEIYVAEAGARQAGDIQEIALLLQPHYAVIGKIGHAHIEYFKNIEATTQTKFELLYSSRLIRAFVQKDNAYPKSLPPQCQNNMDKITPYPPNIQDIESTLEGIRFRMEIEGEWVCFACNILGRFNIDNIAAAILIAKTLGMTTEQIQKAVAKLQPTPHRLQRIDTPNKIIIDDSFNGNLEGMSEAISLASLHNGRKVIVTPGLVEHDEESNRELARQIDSVFELVIITGDLNAQILDSNITKPQKILLKDKTQLEQVLAKSGQPNDLVLFANDAPNYI